MAKRKPKTKKAPSKKIKLPSFKLSNQQKLVLGSFLVIFGIILCIAFISFFFTGEADQSHLSNFTDRNTETKNWLSKTGAWLSDFFIQRGFGVASFIFSGLIFLSGIYVLMNLNTAKLRKHWFWGTLIVIWLSILFGFFKTQTDILGGTVGFELNSFLQDYIGKIGTSLLLLFGLITYLAIRFKVTFESISNLFKSAKKDLKDEFADANKDTIIPVDNNLSDEAEAFKEAFEVNLGNKPEPKPEPTPEPIKVVKTESGFGTFRSQCCRR